METMTTPVASSLSRFNRSYCHLSEQWRNIEFTDCGARRLEHTAGFAIGLNAAGNPELAERVASELCQQLDFLNGYGGQIELHDIKDAETPLTRPAYRILLGDDGTFGGWCIQWFRIVTRAEYQVMLEATPLLDDDEAYSDRDKRIEEKYRIRKEFNEFPRYKPTWWDDNDGGYLYPSTSIHYAYAFNGGLLCHGFDNNPLAVRVGHKDRLWSIHT